MALELNQLVQVDYTGRYLWVTDKTGVYSEDVDSNIVNNGWGIPNFELAESALGVIAIARDEFRTVFENISPQWKFSSSADNATENQFQLSYTKDSIIDVYMIRLMVTYDDYISLDGVLFQEGNYFYNASESVIKRLVGGVIEIVEDVRELIDALPTIEALDGNTISTLCTDAYVVKLSVEYGRMYKQYVVKRREGCDDIKRELYEMLNFKEDIIGARRAYTSGLFSQAQDIIETLTEERNIL